MNKVFIIIVLTIITTYAQQDPNVKSDFYLKEKALIELIDKHQQRLQPIKDEIDFSWKRVQNISELARYPKNIHMIKDTAMIAIVQVRKIADKSLNELKELYFDWLQKSYDLMAIYTRYGELLATAEDKKNVHPELQQFLIKYRNYIDTMKHIVKTINDIKNETDFLLSSKFN